MTATRALALNAEIRRGNDLASQLVDHLRRMGNASSAEIPVTDRGEEYVVSVMPKSDCQNRLGPLGAHENPTGIEAQVCNDITARQAKGVAKYGVTVQDNPLELRAWLQHAYEETLDQAIYLKRAISEIEKHARTP